METKSAREYFASRFSNLLRENNIKQQDFAEVLHVKPATVSQYCRGKTTPDYDILRSIAQYFGVTTDYLLGASEYRTIETQQIAAAELGLSDGAIESLQMLNDRDDSGESLVDVLCLLLEKTGRSGIVLSAIESFQIMVDEAIEYERDQSIDKPFDSRCFQPMYDPKIKSYIGLTGYSMAWYSKAFAVEKFTDLMLSVSNWDKLERIMREKRNDLISVRSSQPNVDSP